MAELRVERRLTAIFASDVVGYSRLLGADEEGTLAPNSTSTAVNFSSRRSRNSAAASSSALEILSCSSF